MSEQYSFPFSLTKLTERNRQLKPLVLLALLFGGILLLSSLTSCSTQQGNAAGDTLATAPDFTFTLFDGKELALSELRGKPVVLNFWASWCPPCRAEARGLERVWQAYKNKGVVFVGVDIQDKEEDARAFLNEFGITYPNGRDIDNEIAVSYGVSGIPTTVLINLDGKVARRWVGAIEEKQLGAFIEEVLR